MKYVVLLKKKLNSLVPSMIDVETIHIFI